MAKKTKVITVCDRHRGEIEAEGLVSVNVAGVTYRLDLCSEHLREFTAAVRPWTRRAASDGPVVVVSPGRTRRKASKSVSRTRHKAGPTNAELREWAAANGYEISGKGRIPVAVRTAFVAAK